MKVAERAMGRRTGRRLAASLALAVGTALVILAPASPAAATPLGGSCVGDYYSVAVVHGLVHEQVGPTQTTQNVFSHTVNWTVSHQVSQTFSSTTTVSGGGSFQIRLGVVTLGAQGSTSYAVTESMTISTTTSVTVPVPPGTWAFAAWGIFKLHTSGVYGRVVVNCETMEVLSEDTVYIDAYTIVAPQPIEGWRVWG